MTKVHAKLRAVEMRKAGHSYSYIVSRTGVSKGTLAVWLADVPYTPNPNTVKRIGRARAASGAAKSKLKLASIIQARKEAASEIGRLSRRDLFMLGLGLYIGEGTKSTMQTVFVNANPIVICLMIRWFTQAIGMRRENLRLRLHVYPDTTVDDAIRFWSRATGLPKTQFRKTMIDWRKDKKTVKLGKLPYGTAHLCVNSLGEKRFGVFLARKISAWSERALGKE
jgi:hypothetical protein